MKKIITIICLLTAMASAQTNISVNNVTALGKVQVKTQPPGAVFPNITGIVEANFSDSDMASGSWNGGIIVNAVASATTFRGVNGMWAKCENRLDSCIGVSVNGAMFNGLLIDTESNLATGGPQTTFNASEYDTVTPNHLLYSTAFAGITNTGVGQTGSIAPTLFFLKRTGISRMGGGWIWLSKNGTGARNNVVAAPTGVVSAVTAGTGILEAGHYRFMVSAYNDVGEGLPSSATTDLTITPGQVIAITWNRVVGARGYRIYAAYGAGGNPGTALASYFAQNPQTTTTVFTYMVDKDALGDGVGTQTGYLSNELATGVLGLSIINTNPLPEDRSAYYYLRFSDITNNTVRPSFDKFNLDSSGFIHQRLDSVANIGYDMTLPAGGGTVTNFMRFWDGSQTWLTLGRGASAGGGIDLGNGTSRAEFTLKAAGGGADGLLYGAVGAATGSGPKFISSSGSITIQGYNVTFSSIEGTSTGLNKWQSIVSDANAATVGAFTLNSVNTISAGNKLLLLQNNGTEKFSVYGDGEIAINGTKFRPLTGTASLDFAAWAGADCQSLTLTVTGAVDGDTVSLGIPTALASTAGVQFNGFVSAANTVTVRGCKITAGASADPAAATVRADVTQH